MSRQCNPNFAVPRVDSQRLPGLISCFSPFFVLVCCRVAQLILSGQDISSLAILTPYNGQVQELQSQQKLLSGYAGKDVSIDISSVDAYQVGILKIH